MNTLIRYKLAIVYAAIFSVGALATEIGSAFAHVSFKELSPEEWLLIITAVISGWSNTLAAFIIGVMHKLPDAPTPAQTLPPINAPTMFLTGMQATPSLSEQARNAIANAQPMYKSTPESGGTISPSKP